MVPVKVNMMQKSSIPSLQNEQYICMDFSTRRSVRTVSMAAMTQTIDEIGPLRLMADASHHHHHNQHQEDHPDTPAQGDEEIDAARAPPAKMKVVVDQAMSQLLRDNGVVDLPHIPTGSLVSLGQRQRASTMFHAKHHFRPLHTGQHRGGGGGSNGGGLTTTDRPPAWHELDAGNSAIDPYHLKQLDEQQRQHQRHQHSHHSPHRHPLASPRLSPLFQGSAAPATLLPPQHPSKILPRSSLSTAPLSTLLHQSLPSSTTLPYSKVPAPSLNTLGWFYHNLEIKPNALKYGKIVQHKGSKAMQVRLQNVGITTLRFRIYSLHEDIVCSNTTPSGPLAPGMKSLFYVTFAPGASVNYGLFRNHIHVVSENECLKIPIQANVLEKYIE